MSLKQYILLVAGLALGGFVTYVLFRETDWAAVASALARANLFWLLILLIMTFGGFFFQSWRWRYVVEAAGPAPYRALFTSTQISHLAHAILPMRGGPLVRAFFLSRSAKLPFSSCLGASIIDRMPELILFCMMVVAAAMVVPLDGPIVIKADIFHTEEPILLPDNILMQGLRFMAAIFAIVMVVIAVILIGGEWLVAQVQRFRLRRLGVGLRHFARIIHDYRCVRRMSQHVGWTVVTFACHYLGAVALLQAFGIATPWYGPLFLLVMTVLAVVLPGVPGFVGQYHVAVVLSLVVLAPDLSGNEMKAVAVAGHGVYVLMMGVLGVVSLFLEHVSLIQLREAEYAALDVEEQET